MDQFNLALAAQDIDFLMEVLQNTPLPFVRSAPLINKIGMQVQAQQAERMQIRGEGQLQAQQAQQGGEG